MTKYIFKETILGSNNGIDVVEYLEGQEINQNELSKELFNAWLERKILEKVAFTGKTEEETEEEETEEETEEEIANESEEEVLEESELINEAKKILENSDVDTDKLNEIGIRLHIKNMEKTVNGDTIVSKVKKFIEEYVANSKENK